MPWDIAAYVVKGFFTGVLRDMRLIPHTSLSALFLWLVVWAAYFFVYPKIVQAQSIVPEVRALRESMTKLNARLIKEQLERDIRSTETDLYNIEREISSLQSRGISVPESIWDRQWQLQRTKERQGRELEQFMRDNAGILARREL